MLCNVGHVNMCSLIASQLLAANTLKDKGDTSIALLYVVGEEVDHIGMKTANALGLKPKYLIVGEPTESRTVLRQKGMFKLRLVSRGIAAHSGYPETGLCALTPLLSVVNAIQSYPWPSGEGLGKTTVNIGLMKSGVAENVVPPNAMATVMFRVVTSTAQIEKIVQTIVNTFGNEQVSIEWGSRNEPADLNPVSTE